MAYPAHLAYIVNIMSSGKPIIFNGGGVYAFATQSISGLNEITRAKKREMLDRPPVIATSLNYVFPLLDWDFLLSKGTFTKLFLSNFFTDLHYTMPVVTIYPVIRRPSVAFFSKFLSNSWGEKMVWNNGYCNTLAVDTLAYPGVKRLVEKADFYGNPVLFFTSANFPGDPTIYDYAVVKKTFPTIDVIQDSFIDSLVQSHKNFGYDEWSSYTTIDLTKIPEGLVEIKRIGSVGLELVQYYFDTFFGRNHLKVVNTKDSKALIRHPSFNNFESMKHLFSNLEQYYIDADTG